MTSSKTSFARLHKRRLPMCFAGLVAMARSLNPIPSRTRPLNSSAPMVLRLKTRESRSLPGLQSTCAICPITITNPPPNPAGGFVVPSSASAMKCREPRPEQRLPNVHRILQPLMALLHVRAAPRKAAANAASASRDGPSFTRLCSMIG